jgi:transcriptional regulator with XRE-family HTH domain
MAYFQKKLKDIMKSKQLTQMELAKLAHISQNTISNWLNDLSSTTLKNLETLADSLNMTVGELIGDFSHNPNLSKEDKKLLALPIKQKKILLKFVDFLNEIEE